MPLVNPNSILRLGVVGIMDGQAILNSFDYRIDGNVGNEEVMPLFKSAWEVNVVANLANTYSVQKYTYREITGRFRPGGIGTNPYRFTYGLISEYPPSSGVGALTGKSYPSFVSLSVRKHSAHNGKNGTGGFRLSGIVKATADDAEHPTTAMNTWALAGANSLKILAAAAGDLQLVIFNATDFLGRGIKPLGVSPLPGNAQYVNDVTTFTVKSFFGSQLSRKTRTDMGR